MPFMQQTKYSWVNREVEKHWGEVARVQLFATPWTVAYQAPQSMEFSRQE